MSENNKDNFTPSDFENLEKTFKEKEIKLETENKEWRSIVTRKTNENEELKESLKQQERRTKKAEDELLKRTQESIKSDDFREEKKFEDHYREAKKELRNKK